MSAAPARLPAILVVEPQFVLRRTVVALARKLELAEVDEATGTGTALALLKRKAFDALVLDLEDVEASFGLLRQLRDGEFPSRRDIAVCLTAAQPLGLPLQDRAAALGATACLPKPYRISQLLDAIGLQAG